ncbi:uncharacterized protein EV420DRAFT_1234571, partial [Desarmillaria tabescens]
RTIVHPIRRIPDEVLGEIFQQCVEIESTTNSIDIRGMPWTLSHVCGRWRGLVMNMGRLWKRVQLDFGEEAHTGSVGSSYLLSKQLLRAVPFDVDVSIEGSPEDLNANHVLHTLIPFSHRFRSLTVEAGVSSYQFLSACKGSFQ